MQDAALAMTALASQLERAVLHLVEVHPPLQQLVNRLRRLCHDGAHSGFIAQTGAGIQGVCDVFLERVVLIRDSRNASLRFRRTRYERIAFAEHRDLPVFRRPQSKT